MYVKYLQETINDVINYYPESIENIFAVL